MATKYEMQMAAVAPLTPDTLLGLDDVPFKVKATSMPFVLEVLDDFSDVLLADGETEVDLAEDERVRLDIEQAHTVLVMGQYIIAGGLIRDDDAAEPSKNMDGEGKILMRGSRGDRDSNRQIEDALGLDSYGGYDLKAEAVCDELATFVCDKIRGNRALMTTLSNLIRGRKINGVKGEDGSWSRVFDVVTAAIHQEGWEYAKDYIADYFLEVPYMARVASEWQEKLGDLVMWLDETEAEKAFERARKKGLIGNPLAVLLDVYEHGSMVLSVSGEGHACRWDNTGGGALWVPDKSAEENIHYNVLSELCGGRVQWRRNAQGANEACYSLDGENWIGEEQGWKWEGATERMFLAAGKPVGKDELLKALSQEAVKYARSCLNTYNQWLSGDIWGVCSYVIDRATGERIEEHDDECWGHYGQEYATAELQSGMLAMAISLHKPH